RWIMGNCAGVRGLAGPQRILDSVSCRRQSPVAFDNESPSGRRHQPSEQVPVFMSQLVSRLPGVRGLASIGVAKSEAVSIDEHAPRIGVGGDMSWCMAASAKLAQLLASARHAFSAERMR